MILIRPIAFIALCGSLCSAERAQADFAAGWNAVRKQDFATARAELAAAANAGDARAALALADLYSQGKGGPVDEASAQPWRQRAAELGDSGAQFALGLRYQNAVPPDVAQATLWMGRAAEQRHPNAQFALGRLLLDAGREVEGFNWLKRAADAGLAEARRAAALCYAEGRGVDKDEVQAQAMNAAADRQVEEERRYEQAELARQAAEEKAARLQREYQRLHDDYYWGYGPWWGWRRGFHSGFMFNYRLR
jgi:TPR repeat protein